MTTLVDSPENVSPKSQSAMRTIGEAATIVGVPQSVLRFWESKFKHIKPSKNKGRRYYNKNDIDLLLKIKHLLYDKGLTIKGAQQYLAKNGNPLEDSSPKNMITATAPNEINLAEVLDRLYKVREKLLAIAE